jgi:predicted membrane-bound spermidine synthase
LFAAGILMLATSLGHDYVLRRIVKYIPDFRMRTIVSVIVLFGPTSICLAMILPFTAKMLIDNVRTSGSTVGNLYALSTIGSIIGTFSAGFILVPVFGYAEVLFVNSAILLIIGLILFVYTKKPVLYITGILMCAAFIMLWIRINSKPVGYIDADTQYNRVFIYNTTDESTGRPVKMLKVNDEKSSAMFTDTDDDLVFDVLKYYRLVEHFNIGFRHSLMIGGSGFAFPKDYLRRYHGAAIDVVEIDPGLTKLAKLHFNLPDDENLGIFHEDGRTYINRCEKKYDAIFMDAYKSMLTIPYQLTTQEAISKIYRMLNDGGAVYANIISSLNSKDNYFLQAEIATYKSIFPQVYILAVQYPNPSDDEKKYFQNLLLIGLKSSIKPEFSSDNEELNNYLSHLIDVEIRNSVQILTDEFAPVEYYASRALNQTTTQK